MMTELMNVNYRDRGTTLLFQDVIDNSRLKGTVTYAIYTAIHTTLSLSLFLLFYNYRRVPL